MQRPPILVFAQSGRFIAESAARAGYPVRVADCFADSDTRAVAENFIQLPSFDALSESELLQSLVSLSRDEACLLICGTGIERFYSVLSQLPAHIEFIGNSPQTLALVRDPQHFFSLLDQLQLPYPPTSLTLAPVPNPLRKRLDSAGGTEVSADNKPLAPGEFYQQKIDGEARSVCFIANGVDFTILGWNRQVNLPGQFLLQQIWQYAAVPAEHAADLTLLLGRLVKATGLRGFNSLDYIVTADDEIFILEINPRISASLELLAAAPCLQWQIDSSRGMALRDMPRHAEKTPIRLLHYCFAESDLEVADTPLWPMPCHDLPLPGTQIRKDQVICTVILAAESEQTCNEQLTDCQQKLMKNCLIQA